MKAFNKEALEKAAFHIRRNIIETIVTNGEGHAGGALSSADIMAVLFTGIMDFDAKDLKNSDKFLLSAGHKCLALYSTLAEIGVFPREQLKSYNQLGSLFPGHPDMTKLAGVNFSTGSLGHGLPLGCGFAIAARIDAKPYKTYVLLGDGEQGEGSNWEAAAFAAHNKLDTLVAILDENTLQINGRTHEVCKPAPYEDRYAASGWSVRVVDGHDVKALYSAFSEAPFEEGKPSMIIAKTTKGKGLSFMEDNVKYHHWNPDSGQKALAMAELAEQGKRWAE